MNLSIKEIKELAEKSLEINRTFGGEVWPKQAMQPSGFMPPDKGAKIINNLNKIVALCNNAEQKNPLKYEYNKQ